MKVSLPPIPLFRLGAPMNTEVGRDEKVDGDQWVDNDHNHHDLI